MAQISGQFQISRNTYIWLDASPYFFSSWSCFTCWSVVLAFAPNQTRQDHPSPVRYEHDEEAMRPQPYDNSFTKNCSTLTFYEKLKRGFYMNLLYFSVFFNKIIWDTVFKFWSALIGYSLSYKAWTIKKGFRAAKLKIQNSNIFLHFLGFTLFFYSFSIFLTFSKFSK